MRRSTHLLLGVAAAAPVAALAPPAGAVGCLCLGLIGGAFPDYLDLRSGAARHLKHRGLSHGGLVLGLSTVAVFIVLDAVARAETDLMPLPASYARLWAACFGLGMLSHLLSDACTRAGIQPLLPLSKRRYWLLPRVLRGRSEGRVNGVARLAAIVDLGTSLAIFLLLHTPLTTWLSVYVSVGDAVWAGWLWVELSLSGQLRLTGPPWTSNEGALEGLPPTRTVDGRRWVNDTGGSGARLLGGRLRRLRRGR